MTFDKSVAGCFFMHLFKAVKLSLRQAIFYHYQKYALNVQFKQIL